MSDQRRIEIRDDPDAGAYVIEIDDQPAGKAVYRIRDGRHVFIHTEIDDEFSGAGLGTRLVQFALDDMRSRGGAVVPLCPLFAAFIKRHSEYEDLVDWDLYERYRKPRRTGSSDVDHKSG